MFLLKKVYSHTSYIFTEFCLYCNIICIYCNNNIVASSSFLLSLPIIWDGWNSLSFSVQWLEDNNKMMMKRSFSTSTLLRTHLHTSKPSPLWRFTISINVLYKHTTSIIILTTLSFVFSLCLCWSWNWCRFFTSHKKGKHDI